MIYDVCIDDCLLKVYLWLGKNLVFLIFFDRPSRYLQVCEVMTWKRMTTYESDFIMKNKAKQNTDNQNPKLITLFQYYIYFSQVICI